ncbi:MAG TPA: glycosyltransferase family A protein [Gammaproteobacteria bacterium]|nr:glycosyltransferase family A protein [Gammaproteobacteria bacterium]
MDKEQHKPAVSVIVPCYNGGRFIDQLLASLARQSFRDFETVIINDGSTDRATLEKLASLPTNIRIINQENRGLAGARNSGFRNAKADLVLTLDCDDSLEPAYLAETVAAMRAAGPDLGFVFTDVRLTGLREGVARRYFKLFDLLFINRTSACLLVRKEAWRNAGGYDETMREGYEDWEFSVRLAEAGYRGYGIAKPLFIYRVSEDGMLMSRSSQLHAKLWRGIRERHKKLYQLPAVLKLWWRTRSIPGELTLIRALNLLALATLLPDSWFSALAHRVRVSRMARSQGSEKIAAS